MWKLLTDNKSVLSSVVTYSKHCKACADITELLYIAYVLIRAERVVSLR